jgi:nucleotide-binding universal stress UspA family protein
MKDRVVAGVDGSPNSAAALRRAIMEARRRGAELDIVYVLVSGPDDAAGGIADPAAVQHGHQVLAKMTSEVCGDGLDVPARQRVEPGVPAKVLVAASEGAQLLVIGARAHSESGNLFGGDTVPYCLNHAPCRVDVCADYRAA